MLTNTIVDLPTFSTDAITEAYYVAFGRRECLEEYETHWAEVHWGYTRNALSVLQATVAQIRAEIALDAPRGRAMTAVISRHGLLEACCLMPACREALREAADVIDGCGSGYPGRRTVYNAAMNMLGIVRPEGATIH